MATQEVDWQEFLEGTFSQSNFRKDHTKLEMSEQALHY
jgi:hypothetical protein